MSGTARLAEPRRRNAADSRERLLSAAEELFVEHGYERTTIRAIGQRAGVDSTLIARYFGSKGGLYLASMRRDVSAGNTPPVDLTDPARIELLLDRSRANGPTPTFYAAIAPHTDAELQAVAMEYLQQRILAPAEHAAAAARHDDSQLRAEIAVAAFAGIALSRASHALETLSSAPSSEVAPLIAQLLATLLTNEAAKSS